MNKPPYRPLNLSSVEITSLECLLKETLSSMDFNALGKVGRINVAHILEKLEKLKVKL